MINQALISEKRTNGNLYHFVDYQKKKPFFKKPVKITIDFPFVSTYYLAKNIVYKEKQILALRTELESKTIFLVEGKIEDGKLKRILKLSDEEIAKIIEIIDRMIE